MGARPPAPQIDEYEPGGTRGWQHEAASRVEVRDCRDFVQEGQVFCGELFKLVGHVFRVAQRRSEHLQSLFNGRNP